MTKESSDAMTNLSKPDNLIDFHAAKSRKLYPLMPERLARAAMVKDFERLHEHLLLRFIKQGLRF